MIINGWHLLDCKPIKNMLPRKVRGSLASHGLAEAGYDLRLKQDIHFTTRLVGGHRENIVSVTDSDGSSQIINGRFTLASACEEFDMPNDLVGVVHDKSTWARHGLSVFNTVIEPGWKGFLTLELVYHGQKDLLIPAGTGIAQVLFHKLAVHAAYDGKYQNQEDKPVSPR